MAYREEMPETSGQGTVRLSFDGLQWQYVQLIMRQPQGTKITAERLRKYTGDKPQKIRSVLAELVSGQYLEPETFALTEKGICAYEEQAFWKGELAWWIRGLGIPESAAEEQAGRLLEVMEPQLIWRIHMQNESFRLLRIGHASQEIFTNFDLSGRLRSGTYEVQAEFLEPEERQDSSGYLGFSRLNQYFVSPAELTVEPGQSRLELTWNKPCSTLEEAAYLREGKQQRRRARKNRLSIPAADLAFTYVRGYHMLEGRLELEVTYRDMGETEQAKKACLLLSLALNGREAG